MLPFNTTKTIETFDLKVKIEEYLNNSKFSIKYNEEKDEFKINFSFYNTCISFIFNFSLVVYLYRYRKNIKKIIQKLRTHIEIGHEIHSVCNTGIARSAPVSNVSLSTGTADLITLELNDKKVNNFIKSEKSSVLNNSTRQSSRSNMFRGSFKEGASTVVSKIPFSMKK
jgi:hypothetical protein